MSAPTKLRAHCTSGHELILAIEQRSRSGLIQCECPMCGARVEAAITPNLVRESRAETVGVSGDERLPSRRDTRAYQLGVIP